MSGQKLHLKTIKTATAVPVVQNVNQIQQQHPQQRILNQITANHASQQQQAQQLPSSSSVIIAQAQSTSVAVVTSNNVITTTASTGTMTALITPATAPHQQQHLQAVTARSGGNLNQRAITALTAAVVAKQQQLHHQVTATVMPVPSTNHRRTAGNDVNK